MARMIKKKESSTVVFIGEGEDDDRKPLLQSESGVAQKFKKTGSGSSLNLKPTPFQGSFIKYLFSEKSVVMRLVSSLCPPFGRFKRIAVDYEGSFLATFLLTATIYWGLISKGKQEEELSRMISFLHASALTLGYLTVVATFTCALSMCTKTAITPRQIVCVLGYGMFGHAIVLLICEVGSDEWFMSLMTLLGGLDSVRICLILLSRTPVPACRFVVCTPVAIIHLLYLVYLHFAIMKT